MADRSEAKNYQEVTLLSLSRSNNFGAIQNKQPYLSQEIIDNQEQNIDFSGYTTVKAPFSKWGGFLTFNKYATYNHDKVEVEKASKIAFVGALEYLNDVRPVTRLMREVLLSGGKVSLFIGFSGGYYQWTEQSAQLFLSAMGIKIIASRKVTSLITELTLQCSSQEYEAFLQAVNLPPSTFSHLIVTTEHSGYRVTGGIGSYVKECDNLYGDSVAILIVDDNRTLNIEKIKHHKWLAPQLFLGFERVKQIVDSNFDTSGDVIEETLECILALYPRIKSIEAQEMLLNKTIDAKRLSLIPSNLKLITACHGSSFHLAKAKRNVLDAENIHVAYREKYTLENADVVILPTDFLRKSYIDNGVTGLTDVSRVKKRLPFDVSRLPKGKKLEAYERLLYIGKTSTIKGFDLFLEVLIELHTQNPRITDTIKEVVIMATSVEIAEPYLQSLYKKVNDIYNVIITSLDREVLLRTLADYSENTLALITYRGDNHPLTVLELMAIGLDFIAANAAGTPELILPGYTSHNLAPADPILYAQAVKNVLENNPKQRSTRTLSLKKEYLLQQKKINDSYNVESINKLPALNQIDNKNIKKQVYIEIVGSKSTSMYKDTLLSIQQQTYRSIVTDSSKSLKNSLKMRLYEGDILLPDAIELMVDMYNRTPNCAVVMGYETVMSFNGDGTKRGIEEFHPYAPELGSVFLQEKYSRRMVAIFDEDYLDNSYTDWQKSIAAACKGKKIMVVPRVLSKLADIEGYFVADPVALSSKFAHSFTALPVFDATILYSELERFDKIYWGLRRIGHLPQHFPDYEEALRQVNISPRVVRIVGAYHRFTPRPVKKILSTSGDITFKTLRKVKKILRK